METATVKGLTLAAAFVNGLLAGASLDKAIVWFAVAGLLCTAGTAPNEIRAQDPNVDRVILRKSLRGFERWQRLRAHRDPYSSSTLDESRSVHRTALCEADSM
jgi:hypothetical protein